MDQDICMINCLPNELITMILQRSDYTGILCFGSTCKRFNEMVNNDQSLWKLKFKSTLRADIFEIVNEHCAGNWLLEMKKYCTLKHRIYNELIAMSPVYYWRPSEVMLEDVRNIFAYALTDSLSYYYVITILQDLIKKGIKSIEECKCIKPYTLTEMHYAKVAVCHLIHAYLAIKWIKSHVQNELSPEVVITFFIQWVDTDNLHLDEDVANKITELVKKVESLLNIDSTKVASASKQENLAQGVNERKVLEAVTQVIYQRHLAVTSAASMDTLNIVKVIDQRCGNVISVAAIYQAVAKRFGVKCELIAFPNHLFLEWRDNSCGIPLTYTIDLGTGKLQPKRQCPFSRNDQNNHYKYYPDSLLQYIYSSFHRTMGDIKDWNTRNSFYLQNFLGTHDSQYNPYRNFLPYLFDLTHLPATSTPLDLKYLNKVHVLMLNSLLHLNTAYSPVVRPAVPKYRGTKVKYAVGMVCRHRLYDYVCIVRGWDAQFDSARKRRMEMETLQFGPDQPFYHVLAADQSERYVAQENLIQTARPTRLYHLEEQIARDFTHFNGFAYIPNDEKKIEYPEDGPVCSLYQSRYEIASNVTD